MQIDTDAFQQAFDDAYIDHLDTHNAAAASALGLAGAGALSLDVSGLCANWAKVQHFVDSVAPFLRFIPGVGSSMTVVLAVLTALEKSVIPVICPAGSVTSNKLADMTDAPQTEPQPEPPAAN